MLGLRFHIDFMAWNKRVFVLFVRYNNRPDKITYRCIEITEQPEDEENEKKKNKHTASLKSIISSNQTSLSSLHNNSNNSNCIYEISQDYQLFFIHFSLFDVGQIISTFIMEKLTVKNYRRF